MLQTWLWTLRQGEGTPCRPKVRHAALHPLDLVPHSVREKTVEAHAPICHDAGLNTVSVFGRMSSQGCPTLAMTLPLGKP